VGTDVKVQQELLRHADIRTTLNIYTTAVSEQKREAAGKVVRMILPRKEDVQNVVLDTSGHAENQQVKAVQ
jgi:hypothetical protein